MKTASKLKSDYSSADNFSVVQSIGFASSAPRIPSGRLPCREQPFVWLYNEIIQLHTCIDVASKIYLRACRANPNNKLYSFESPLKEQHFHYVDKRLIARDDRDGFSNLCINLNLSSIFLVVQKLHCLNLEREERVKSRAVLLFQPEMRVNPKMVVAVCEPWASQAQELHLLTNQ